MKRALPLLFGCLLLPSFAARAEPVRVRIGVFGLLEPQELVVRPATGVVVMVEAAGESWILESGQILILRRDGELVRGQRSGATVGAPVLRVVGRRGGPSELVLSVPGKIERRFRGRLEVRVGNGVLLPVVEMDLETAVASTVAAESPPAAPLEALKAQAVASRSFYLASHGRHEEYDFCDTTHCQFLRQPPARDDPASMATRATRGLVLQYGSATVPALYTASCGGRTRTLAEVGLDTNGYPYFSVDCPHCRQRAPAWETRLQAGPVAELLSAHRTEQARLATGRQMGWSTVPSNNYSAEWQGKTLVVRGRGRGHGVGLCQEGAAALAGDGMTYQQILQHYYPNAVLGSFR